MLAIAGGIKVEGLDYPEAVLLLSDITLQFYPTVHWAAMEVFYVTSVSRPKSWPGSGRGAVALEMGFGGVTEGKIPMDLRIKKLKFYSAILLM